MIRWRFFASYYKPSELFSYATFLLSGFEFETPVLLTYTLSQIKALRKTEISELYFFASFGNVWFSKFGNFWKYPVFSNLFGKKFGKSSEKFGN